MFRARKTYTSTWNQSTSSTTASDSGINFLLNFERGTAKSAFERGTARTYRTSSRALGPSCVPRTWYTVMITWIEVIEPSTITLAQPSPQRTLVLSRSSRGSVAHWLCTIWQGRNGAYAPSQRCICAMAKCNSILYDSPSAERTLSIFSASRWISAFSSPVFRLDDGGQK